MYPKWFDRHPAILKWITMTIVAASYCFAAYYIFMRPHGH